MNKYKTFEELKEELGNNYDLFMYEINLQLLIKIDKAVEYIKMHIEKCNIDGYEGEFDNFDIFTKPKKLLNILNGRSDE